MYLPFVYANGLPAIAVKLLLYMKYGIVSFLATILFLKIVYKIKRLRRFELIGLFVLVWSMIIVLFSYITGRSLNLQKIPLFIFPFISYYAGRSFKVKYENFAQLSRVLVFIYVLVSFYAILDIAFIDDRLWRDVLQQGNFLLNIKNVDEGGIIDGLIGNYYYSPYLLRIRRAIGTTGDPLSFAYSGVLPFMLLLIGKDEVVSSKFIRKTGLTVIAIAILLTITRAIILSILIVLIVRFLFGKKYVIITYIIGISMLFLIAGSGPIIQTLTGLNDSSSSGHFNSLSSIFNLSFQSVLFGQIVEVGKEPIAFESGFLNYIVTLGLVMSVASYYYIKCIICNLSKSGTKILEAIAICGTVGVFTSFVFSESFYSFTGFGMFWFVAGLAGNFKFINENKSLLKA